MDYFMVTVRCARVQLADAVASLAPFAAVMVTECEGDEEEKVALKRRRISEGVKRSHVSRRISAGVKRAAISRKISEGVKAANARRKAAVKA